MSSPYERSLSTKGGFLSGIPAAIAATAARANGNVKVAGYATGSILSIGVDTAVAIGNGPGSNLLDQNQELFLVTPQVFQNQLHRVFP